MVLLKPVSTALAVWLAVAHFQVLDAAPTPPTAASPPVKRALLSTAPLASDISGAHLLMENDVDSSTAKHAFLLLSKPRGYYDGMKACLSMGDGGYIFIPGTAGANSLVSLLKKNAPAQVEVSAYSQFWVYNGIPGVLDNCLAINKQTGKTDWIPCDTQLPTVCFNSVMRRVLLFDDASRQIKVNTPVGPIQGWRDQNAFRFLGIPYAEPPVGDLRFAAPVAKAPFKQTWDAIRYKGVCPQTTQSAGFIPMLLSYLENGAGESEDCLNLNVYTPSLKGPNEPLLPVMFYLHGGGFTTYSGSVIIFEPGNMVSRGGVVVVTINYRLGMLGWMENEAAWSRSSIPGNQAFRDQILALQWVKQNIASFGGDPNRVTVFGESAGATSIRALLSASSTWGLYQSVIAQSDPINIPFKLPSSAAQITSYFMEALGCGVTDLVCARSKSVDQVLEAQTIANAKALVDDKWTTWALVQRPTIDGQLIPAEFSQLVKTGKYNTKANVMWTSTKDEAGLFVPQYFPNPVPVANASAALELFFDTNRAATILGSEYFQLDPNDSDAVRNLFTRAGTQYYFFCPLRYLSRQMTKNKKVYNLRFNRGRDTPLVGEGYCSSSTGRVCHSADIQPVFASGASIPGFSQKGDDARFARQAVDRFTAFAKTGDPNPKPDIQGVEASNPDVTSVNWTPYDDANPILELNVKSSMSQNLENDVCSWADTTFLYDFWIKIPGNAP
ncbi:Carboxylesterase family-domain-containing protein [Lobosporangium transversale]|uniref:Carboxylesterase family-domain-containing protein n=1 Tax=Lobosporangium transversale TaxID=64571 RepID=A0A1Y2GNB1_9FUNG|nr:Carboxylesterase family-domain-containing protein [Lobosporangium transversale]ORZ16673.1 Carboxylesterase family-domain-containing protein [Lobosporangium transversale]|eukprot:XP_021881608.1 Carboxylesterase family-domain-containing protein [Lobosporangium transversale]